MTGGGRGGLARSEKLQKKPGFFFDASPNRSIWKTAEELRAAVIDLLGRLNGEGVVYAEVRLCPALHTLDGLTEQQVGANSEVGANKHLMC